MKKKLLDTVKLIKKELIDIKVFLLKDKFRLIVFGLSFIILIIGTIIFNFLIGFLIFVLSNSIWVIPYISW